MELSRTDNSCRGAPNLARLVSVSVRAFHGLILDSARCCLLFDMIFYRYMKSHGLETLRDGRFKMASVLGLNDPFEGLGCCVGVLPEETVKNHFKEELRQNGVLGMKELDAAWNLLSKDEKHGLRVLYSN